MHPSQDYASLRRVSCLFCLWMCLAPPSSLFASEDAFRYRDLEGPLGATEAELFEDIRDGRLDSFSLFSAALVAGGIQDRDRIAYYEERIESLILEMRPEVEARTSETARAREVFEFMHRMVLRGGYQLECSRLSTVLDDGRYNCVSASILYKVLAGRFGLRIMGLEVPGHAMCRLYLQNETLEIESTCPRWFSLIDQPEKRAEVVRKAMGYPSGGSPPECREVDDIQWLATIYYNRGIDLLSEKDFAGAVAANAKALRFDRTNEIARGNLVASLNNWAIHLSMQDLYATAVEKLDRGLAIDPDFDTLRANHVHVTERWVDALGGAGRFEEGARVAFDALSRHPGAPVLTEKLLEVFDRWARREFREEHFDAAFLIFDEAESRCGPNLRPRVARLESAAVIDAATDMLRQGRKSDALALYDAALRRNPTSMALVANRRTLVSEPEEIPSLIPVSTRREPVL